MSAQKQKPKQKKSDAHLELERRCDELMCELLNKDHQLKKSEQNACRIGVELHQAKVETQSLKCYIKDQFEKLHLSNENFKARISELTSDKNELQIQVATLKAKIQFQRREHDDQSKEKQRQFDDARRHYATQLGRFEMQATQYAVSINERQAMLAQRTHLLKLIDDEKQEFKLQIADRDRDKIQSVDALKIEMKDKFKDMKSNLLSIRRQQLDNNTRLTLLQNHQLLQQLQYQSTNTEKIVSRNVEMQRRIKQLQNQLEIHNDVEKQVAKRSAISRKIIKTYQEKNLVLEKENDELQRSKKDLAQNNQTQEDISLQNTSLSKNVQIALHKIKILQKQIVVKSTQLQQLTKKYTILKGQTSQKQRITELICRYYYECITDKVGSQSDNIDLQKLHNLDVKQWQSWELQLVVEGILNQLKTHITPAHLDQQTWRKVADTRIAKLAPSNIQNVLTEEINQEKRNDYQYIRSLSLQKNKLFYQNRRKISVKNQRSLTRVNSNNSVSFGKYVQTHLREWGAEIKADSSKSLVQRFKKPLKTKLK